MRTPVTVGVVGLGAKGLTLARAFAELPGAELRWIADHSAHARMRSDRQLAGTCGTGELDDLLGDDTLDAIVIATPPATRHRLALRALDAGKHVMVVPPVAFSSEDADEVVRLAEAGGLRLRLEHDLLFHPGLVELRDEMAKGRLGDVQYVYGGRRGLEPSASAEGVLWEAGTAVLSMVLWLVADEPVEVTARGGQCFDSAAPDVAFCHLHFATGIEAQITLSSVEPQEFRELTVVGSAAMAVFDELAPGWNLTLCDRVANGGSRVSPRLAAADPLRSHCEDFLSSVRSPSYSRSAAGREAAAVVGVLEALERSLRRGGRAEPIGVPGTLEPIEIPRQPLAGVIQMPVRSA